MFKYDENEVMTINIANFEKVSLQDYPGKVSAICFINGCQLRCPYCHNPNLVLPQIYNGTQNKTFQFIEYIKKRKRMIEGVVLSGGEPLMEKGLIDLIYTIKELGLKVKLDTNGMLPNRLKVLIDEDLLDYIALDYKGYKNSFNRSVGLSSCDTGRSLYNDWARSLEIMHNSSIEYELRTTVVRELYSREDLNTMAKELKVLIGSKKPKWFLQKFEERLDILNKLTEGEKILSAYSKDEMISIKEEIKQIIPSVSLR